MKANTFSYHQRNCSVCDGGNTEGLWSYDHLTRTRNYYWKFTVNNVICEDCGFVFVSPVPDSDELGRYYQDSIVSYPDQELDYDIDRRLDLIYRHKNELSVFMELGSNQKTRFSQEIEKIFSKVVTVEPNIECASDYSTMADIPSNSIHMLASYFVLEHLPSLGETFIEFQRVIADGGVLICEIPDIRMYPDNIIACHQHEHVNHFSPALLSRLAARYGFKEIESSVVDCSRDYGFVSVYRREPSGFRVLILTNMMPIEGYLRPAPLRH